MKPKSCAKFTHTCRYGAAVMELAVVLPVLLVLLVGAIELGHGISVNRKCTEAARAGARVYSMRKHKTEADVRAIVAKVMAESNFESYTVNLDPPPSPNIKQLDPLTVTVSMSVADSTWHQAPWFFSADARISSSCTMPADLGESKDEEVAAPPIVNTATLIDKNPSGESSGVTAADLKKLEQVAENQVKKATKAREDADKKADDAAKAVAKAVESGDPEDVEKAAKKQQQANAASAQATAEEELARQYLQALTTATAGHASPQVISPHNRD